MTGKERAEWRAKANHLEPLFQLGKGGISDAFIDAVNGALNTRELIKFKVLLETSPLTPREAANEVAEKTGAEVIQVIGGVIVLYRYNPKLHEDEKKKKPKDSLGKITFKEYWAMVIGAFRAFWPILLMIILGFGMMIGLAYLWLK